MRTIVFAVVVLLSQHLNAQEMENPQQIVTNLFVATDQRDWDRVEQIFHKEVVLDYSSMNGNPAAKLTPEQIIAAWKSILPGFENTHHQLGNFVVSTEASKADVFCYGTASHYLSDENGSLWTVVGSYDFKLLPAENGTWEISSMKFNFKFQNGNTSLPEKAMNNAKGVGKK